MAFTKGQERKFQAMLKSVDGNTKAANAMFKIWMDAQPVKGSAASVDPIAEQIETMLAPLAKNKKFKLGNRGYTIKRSKGKGSKGFVVTRNE